MVAILANLAVIHAKGGQPELAAEALEKAAVHDMRCDSSRTNLLRLHAAGIVDLFFGRYASGIETFKAAIALGEDLKDLHIVAFDLVYLCECHIFRGELKAAQAALNRIERLDASPPPPIPAMVEARRALIAARRGDRALPSRSSRKREETNAGAMDYLTAWNRIFWAWAHRLTGDFSRAQDLLESARSFFKDVGVPAGEIHAEIELAALHLENDRPSRAERYFRSVRSRFPMGEGPLENPMLCARLLAYQSSLRLDQNQDAHEATGSLTAAA